MLVHCTSCNQQTDAKIDRKTGIVVCAICGGEVKVTSFTRQAMQTNRDFVEEGKTGFCFRCDKCREIQPAVVDPTGKKALCTKCGSEMSGITSFMIGTLRRMGKVTGKQEVKKDEE